MNKPRPSISSCFRDKSSSGRGCSVPGVSANAHSRFLQEQQEPALRDHSPLGMLTDTAQCHPPHHVESGA